MSYWRQGDVYFESVPQPPEMRGARRRSVLYHGERTGHAHRIVAETLPLVLPNDGEYLVAANGPFTVVHEEHGPIQFAPGYYRVWRQRVFTGGHDWATSTD